MQALTERNAKENREDRGDGNELRFIYRALLNATSEKDRIELQLQKHQQTLRSNMLNRLLKGKLDQPVPYEEAFRSFNMPLLSHEFAVLLFVLENEEELYAKLPHAGRAERGKLIPFIITNVVEELAAQRKHAGYVAEIDDMMVCLVSFRPGTSDARSELEAIASDAQRFLRRYEMELTVSISGKHLSWPGIAEAYQEAIDAMAYKMVLGKTGIIAYEDIRRETSKDVPSVYYYPLQVEQQLINFIKAGDIGQASAYMDDITGRNFGKPLMSLTLARCLIFNLAGTMVKAIGELDGGDNGTLANNPEWMDKMFACDTVQEMQQELQSLLAEVCASAAAKRALHASREREGAQRSLAVQVARYVEEHYTDANLNVSAIGEHFELKGSYLSKLFKNQSGDGLLDLIHKIRIRKAKEMIFAKGDSINEISRLVGYNDAATFIRVFKKYEGITPGKYKEIELAKGAADDERKEAYAADCGIRAAVDAADSL